MVCQAEGNPVRYFLYFLLCPNEFKWGSGDFESGIARDGHPVVRSHRQARRQRETCSPREAVSVASPVASRCPEMGSACCCRSKVLSPAAGSPRRRRAPPVGGGFESLGWQQQSSGVAGDGSEGGPWARLELATPALPLVVLCCFSCALF
jgi:hypothetical protein